MSINVKFFARLREQLNLDEVQLDAKVDMTALDTWQQATGQADIPAKILVAINHEYAELSTVVKDNDEVAFFPPVTGG